MKGHLKLTVVKTIQAGCVTDKRCWFAKLEQPPKRVERGWGWGENFYSVMFARHAIVCLVTERKTTRQLQSNLRTHSAEISLSVIIVSTKHSVKLI